MRKKLILVLALCLGLCSLTGCAGEGKQDKLSVVAVRTTGSFFAASSFIFASIFGKSASFIDSPSLRSTS